MIETRHATETITPTADEGEADRATEMIQAQRVGLLRETSALEEEALIMVITNVTNLHTLDAEKIKTASECQTTCTLRAEMEARRGRTFREMEITLLGELSSTIIMNILTNAILDCTADGWNVKRVKSMFGRRHRKRRHETSERFQPIVCFTDAEICH